MSEKSSIGFIGLGVMGEPMCGHVVRKSGRPVVAFDLSAAPLDRIGALGAKRVKSVADVVAQADIVLLSLPGGKEVRSVCEGADGLLARARRGQAIVDLSTTPYPLTREIAEKLSAAGVDFADAPVARTRAAAIDGTLSVMVGGAPAVYARIEPVLRTFASEVTHCGGHGAGQVVKILNNMVLMETVVGLAEAAAIAKRAGVEPRLLFETLSKGSADSFAVRNHGLKGIVPGNFPKQQFSTVYMLKDADCALELAAHVGVAAKGAEVGRALVADAIARGETEAYWPVIAKFLDEASSKTSGKT
jgi:hypothetical protein